MPGSICSRARAAHLGVQVLCSVPDVSVALAEAARVLRPGGRLLYVEHVAAPPDSLLRVPTLCTRLLRPELPWLASCATPPTFSVGVCRVQKLLGHHHGTRPVVQLSCIIGMSLLKRPHPTSNCSLAPSWHRCSLGL